MDNNISTTTGKMHYLNNRRNINLRAKATVKQFPIVNWQAKNPLLNTVSMKTRFTFLVTLGLVTSAFAQTNNEQNPTRVVISFLKWYKFNYPELQVSKLGYYSESNNRTIYVVDTVRTQQYISLFKKSGFVTNEYITYWQNYFKTATEKYKKEKDVEFADAFDHDFVLLTQEIKDSLDAIENPKIISEQIGINESEVKLSVGCNLSFKLIKVEGNWRVNSIENLGLLK